MAEAGSAILPAVLRRSLLLLLVCSLPAQATQVTLLDQPQPGQVAVRVTEDDPLGQWPVRAGDGALLNALRQLSQLLPNPLVGAEVRCVPQVGDPVKVQTDDRGRAHCPLPAGAGAVRVEVSGASPQTAPDWNLGSAAHLTVTDLDDTVIVTGVKSGGLSRALRQNALTRPIFADLPPLLQQQAARGPVVYLSGSPDGLDASLRQLLAAHAFPPGPLLLRDWPRVATTAHKGRALDALASQSAATFTLIGDSGEADPETYAAFVRRWPGRTERILIRDIGPGARHAEVERLLRGLGVPWGWLPGPSSS